MAPAMRRRLFSKHTAPQGLLPMPVCSLGLDRGVQPAGLWAAAVVCLGQGPAHLNLGVRPARMTLSLVAITSTSSPLTYAWGSLAAR